ncbi:hypothetical protein IMZ48_16495 [Candidatus Bathyarchaeota archaeon]|nr:hypothetical protein [Candidatus Bathyarchaeota archaeon]
MAHTEAKFQESYQPRQVCENLLKVAFGRDRAGDDKAQLFALLRNASLKRDELAPIDLTPEELQGFEQRRDVRLLRALYAETTEKRAREDLRAQRNYLKQILSRLLIEKKRKEYFANVDRMRALGLPTDLLRARRPEPPSGMAQGGAVAIGRFLDSGRREGQMELCVTLFVSYLRHRPAEVVFLAGEAPDPVDHTTHDPKRSRCLLGCGSFGKRDHLTRHVGRFHLDKGTFDQPFLCPECLVNSPPQESLIRDLSDWCSHTKAKHRQKDAPKLLLKAGYTPKRPRAVRKNPPKTLPCLICTHMFSREGGLTHHITTAHAKKGHFNNRVFPCPECARVGIEPA